MVKFLNEACVPLRSPCVQYEKVVPTLTNTSSRYRLMSVLIKANYTWAWRMRDGELKYFKPRRHRHLQSYSRGKRIHECPRIKCRKRVRY